MLHPVVAERKSPVASCRVGYQKRARGDGMSNQVSSGNRDERIARAACLLRSGQDSI